MPFDKFVTAFEVEAAFVDVFVVVAFAFTTVDVFVVVFDFKEEEVEDLSLRHLDLLLVVALFFKCRWRGMRPCAADGLRASAALNDATSAKNRMESLIVD